MKVDFNERDPRALKYWRDKGYTQMAIASISECFAVIDALIELSDDRANDIKKYVDENLFTLQENKNGDDSVQTKI
jgi:hypothetical protein